MCVVYTWLVTLMPEYPAVDMTMTACQLRGCSHQQAQASAPARTADCSTHNASESFAVTDLAAVASLQRPVFARSQSTAGHVR